MATRNDGASGTEAAGKVRSGSGPLPSLLYRVEYGPPSGAVLCIVRACCLLPSAFCPAAQTFSDWFQRTAPLKDANARRLRDMSRDEEPHKLMLVVKVGRFRRSTLLGQWHHGIDCEGAQGKLLPFPAWAARNARM